MPKRACKVVTARARHSAANRALSLFRKAFGLHRLLDAKIFLAIEMWDSSWNSKVTYSSEEDWRAHAQELADSTDRDDVIELHLPVHADAETQDGKGHRKRPNDMSFTELPYWWNPANNDVVVQQLHKTAAQKPPQGMEPTQRPRRQASEASASASEAADGFSAGHFGTLFDASAASLLLTETNPPGVQLPTFSGVPVANRAVKEMMAEEWHRRRNDMLSLIQQDSAVRNVGDGPELRSDRVGKESIDEETRDHEQQ